MWGMGKDKPPAGSLVPETGAPNVENIGGEGFLKKWLEGPRKTVAMGLGALVLMMSGSALAQGKPEAGPDRGRVKAADTLKAGSAEVRQARKAFENYLRIIIPNEEKVTRILRVLDETIAGEGLDDPALQVQAIELFRGQIERRQAEKEVKPGEKPGTLEFTGPHATGKLQVRRAPGGRIVIEAEARLVGGAAQYAEETYLKPDFMTSYKGLDDKSEVRMKIRLAVQNLLRNDEAAAAADAQGKPDIAAALRRANDELRKDIIGKYGDVLK